MTERGEKMIKEIIHKFKNKFKTEEESKPIKFKLETVQGFYAMEDYNKWLKFNAITREQLDRTTKFEEQFQSIIKQLYVPDYQSEKRIV